LLIAAAECTAVKGASPLPFLLLLASQGGTKRSPSHAPTLSALTPLHLPTTLALLVLLVCRQQMADAGVSGVVVADVLDDFSNDVVLTTQWIDGELTPAAAAATCDSSDVASTCARCSQSPCSHAMCCVSAAFRLQC
jgi:hypothetical protein